MFLLYRCRRLECVVRSILRGAARSLWRQRSRIRRQRTDAGCPAVRWRRQRKRRASFGPRQQTGRRHFVDLMKAGEIAVGCPDLKVLSGAAERSSRGRHEQCGTLPHFALHCATANGAPSGSTSTATCDLWCGRGATMTRAPPSCARATVRATSDTRTYGIQAAGRLASGLRITPARALPSAVSTYASLPLPSLTTEHPD